MSNKVPVHPHPSRPEADNWDGPYYRPYYCEEIIHREWAPDHLLSLNALDPEGCWLYTVSGHGIYRCGNQRRVLGPGQLLAYRSPDRGRLCMDKHGMPWHTIGLHVTGELGLAMFDSIQREFGMFQELPLDCAAVKLAGRILRLVNMRNHRSPHFWSRITFAWLDSWWECAQRSSGPLSGILRESSHSSRLLGLSTSNVKALAEQLGFSRSHLSRKLKWQWNRPPGAVLREVRMEEAARLLRTTDLSIGNVATKLGFSAASALTRAFKKAHGVGPLVYRQSVGTARPGRQRAAGVLIDQK